ncbi:biotin transporter BioY [Pelagibius sp. Alg239-R121]|uniref:biotin transporter BioY n=1 Tax=Pelagibius sp. Alg239-R121 TaxID=2993448 RepID=UPI0024A63268|nr:biotin transporter BioY [Pelagibius sp. Alg239-R121]
MTLHAALSKNFDESMLRNVGIAIVGSLLLTLSAKVSIPFYPVPLTLQTFVVIGLGLALGPTLGLAAVGLYLMQGAFGLPVFAGTPEKGIGLAYMAGPTGGYLLGYLFAAFAAGLLAKRGWDRNVFGAFAAALVGGVVLYLPGLLWLGSLFGWDKPILEWGLYPFVLGDLTKAALAAAVFPAAWRFLKARGIG